MKNLIIVSIVLMMGSILSAQELITDRPDQTESSAVVPHKYFQLETGISLEKDKFGPAANETEYQMVHFGSTLLRYGLMDFMELRFGTELGIEKLENNFDKEEISGLNGVHLGTKIYLSNENGFVPQAAMIVSAGLPIGEEEFVSDAVEPKLQFAFSHTLTEKLGLGYNLGVEWPDKTRAVGIYSCALGFGISKTVGTFIESYGNFGRGMKPIIQFDSGLTFLTARNFQLDMSFGIAYTDIAVDWFFSTGFAFRLPR